MNSHLLMALGFAIAFVATAAVGRYGYATIFLLALIETQMEFRYPFHSVVRDYLLRDDLHQSGKIALQVKLLIGLGIAGAGLLLLLAPFAVRQSVGRQLMMLGSVITVAMLGIELISLHYIDTLIYHSIASFALCAIIYFLGASIATGGALLEGRRRRKHNVAA